MSPSASVARTSSEDSPISFARLAAILAVFTVVLTVGGTDMTKVAVALPEITEQLSLNPIEALWAADAYALTTGVAIIPCAVLADRYGRKRVYLAGLPVALVAAVLTGFASGPAGLIAGRIGQGIGSALLIAATVAIIRVSFPTLRSRGFAYGVWVASFSAGTGLGPLLGGVLIEHLSWNWVFWVTVPVFGLCLLAAALVVPESRNTNPPGLDAVSILASTATIAAVILTLKSIPRDDAAVTAPTLLAVAAIGLAVFCLRQARLSRPYLDLALFKNPVLTVSALSIAATTGLFNGILYLLTQELQAIQDASAIATGVALLPLAAASVLGGMASPTLTRWISSSQLIMCGFIFTTLGTLLITSKPDAAHPAGLALLGLGAGTVMAIASNKLMSSAPTTRTADAGAIQESAFALGAGTGIASLGVIALHYGSIHGNDLAGGIHTTLGLSAIFYAFFGIAAALILMAQKRGT